MAINGNELVPSEWNDGERITVEEWGNKQWSSGNRTGQETGIKMAVKFLTDKAAERFIAGKDSEANMIRSLSQELKSLIGG